MRYIDPYQLADKVTESMYNNPHEGKIALNHRLEHEHFLRMIALAPDADVAPVVHGYWDGNGNCSACGKNIYKDMDADVWSCYEPPYCPNCGAKMNKRKGECEDD